MGLLGRKGQARKPVINIIAILEVKNREEFNKFETQAIQIIRSHGGKLVAAFEPDTSSSSDSDGIEVHYIQFSDLDKYNSYRADPALAVLSQLRSRAIRSTQLYVSDKVKAISNRRR